MNRPLNAKQKEEFVKCAKSARYFLENYGWIKHTSRGAISWKKDPPYPYQIELWERLQAGEDIIVNKTRQIGCSWAAAGYCLWKILFHPDVEVLFLSEKEKKAIRLLGYVKFMYNHLPSFLRPDIGTNSQTRFSVIFRKVDGNTIIVKESSIDSLTTTGRSGASYSATLVVLDEAAHLPNSEETWEAIRPAASHGGQMLIISTPNGTSNFFFRIWQAAIHGIDDHFHPIRAYWKDCGLSEEWYKTATSGLTPYQIAQEFELEFVASGSPFFDQEALADCYKPKEKHPELWLGGTRIDRPTKMSYTGVDVAEGGGGDYTSIITLNEYGVEIASWHSNSTPVEQVAGYTMAMDDGKLVNVDGVVSKHHRKYPGAMVIERFGAGDMVYFRHSMRLADPDSYVIGRRTKAGARGRTSKMRMLNLLRTAIAGKQVVIRDPFTYSCFVAFQDIGDGKAEAAGGYYDDPVIAFALAYSELHKNGGFVLELDTNSFSGRRAVDAVVDDGISMSEFVRMRDTGNTYEDLVPPENTREVDLVDV